MFNNPPSPRCSRRYPSPQVCKLLRRVPLDSSSWFWDFWHTRAIPIFHLSIRYRVYGTSRRRLKTMSNVPQTKFGRRMTTSGRRLTKSGRRRTKSIRPATGMVLKMRIIYGTQIISTISVGVFALF